MLSFETVGTHFRSNRGFTLIELLLVVAIMGILAAVAIGVTPGIIQATKGQSAATQLTSFLKRTRELAISRRRNIEIRFLMPNQVQSAQRGVPDPPNPTPATFVLETVTFEGRLGYRQLPGVPTNTPALFGLGPAINLNGALVVMFTSDGAFTDVNGDPVNAQIFVGVPQQSLSENSIAILGTTAAIRSWRWNGLNWVE